MNIVQITDLHLSKDKGNELYNINTYNSAKIIIEYISKCKKNVDYLIITGDISEDSTMQSYSHLLDLLKPIKSDIYLMAGNHDSYEQIKLCCSRSTVKSDVFFSNDVWVVFMFNTKKEHSPNGFLKRDEIELFKKLLYDYPNKNFMVFLHHHPVLIGSESMDTMIIENSQLLIDLIKSHNNIKGVSWGHIHNVFETKINNAKLFSSPSTCFQSQPKSKKFTIDSNSHPGYRIINLNEKGVIETSVVRVKI
jgi:Icc protein